MKIAKHSQNRNSVVGYGSKWTSAAGRGIRRHFLLFSGDRWGSLQKPRDVTRLKGIDREQNNTEWFRTVLSTDHQIHTEQVLRLPALSCK
jgi:hypothetical protein